MRRLYALPLLFACLFLFSLSWENAIVVSGLGTVGRLLGALAVLSWLGGVLLRGRVARPSVTVGLMIAFLLYSAATYFNRLDVNSSFPTALTSVQLAVVVWMLWDLVQDGRSLRLALLSVVLGAYVGVGLTVYQFASDQPTRFYDRYSGGGFDPNDLGLILSLSVPLAWWLGGRVGFAPLRLLLRVYPAACLFALVLTASRSALVTFVCGLAYIVYDVLLGRSHDARTRWAFGLTLALGGTLIGRYAPADSLARLSTIGSEITGGNLNDRRDIWAAAWSLGGDAPLLGLGVGRFAPDLRQYFIESIVAHNTLITVAVEQGVVGAVLFLLFAVSLAVNVATSRSSLRPVWLACLTCLAVGTFTLTWNQRKLTWVLPTLALCSLRLSREPAASPSPSSLGVLRGEAHG